MQSGAAIWLALFLSEYWALGRKEKSERNLQDFGHHPVTNAQQSQGVLIFSSYWIIWLLGFIALAASRELR